MTKNDDLFCAGLVIICREVAAHHRRHTQNSEEILRHISAGVALRIVLVGQVDCRSVLVRGHLYERSLRATQVLVILVCWNRPAAKVVVRLASLRID